MKIVGFLQNYNNVKNGFLSACLMSMRQVCDEIVVYDDASEEPVRKLYDDFGCVVLYGRKNEFWKELYHKQELLAIALRMAPEWICWFDTDAMLGRHWEDRDRARETLEQCDKQGVVLLHLHNLNLWRNETFYRTDESFNDLWHGVFWKNTGQLYYTPVGKLHQKQFPHFYHDQSQQTITSRFPNEDGKLLHFGFATDEEIASKYFKYRANGQSGWALDRLVMEGPREVEGTDWQDEDRKLIATEATWFPEWWMGDQDDYFDGAKEPPPIFDPKEMAKIESFEDWKSQMGLADANRFAKRAEEKDNSPAG